MRYKKRDNWQHGAAQIAATATRSYWSGLHVHVIVETGVRGGGAGCPRHHIIGNASQKPLTIKIWREIQISFMQGNLSGTISFMQGNLSGSLILAQQRIWHPPLVI
jgi:hypothetical protein